MMKKSILNIGKALNKAEQKLINGGLGDHGTCLWSHECGPGEACTSQATYHSCTGLVESWIPGYCILVAHQ